jgi:hypothetical protein
LGGRDVMFCVFGSEQTQRSGNMSKTGQPFLRHTIYAKTVNTIAPNWTEITIISSCILSNIRMSQKICRCWWNIYYYSVRKQFKSCLLNKTLKNNIWNAIISPVVLCGCETRHILTEKTCSWRYSVLYRVRPKQLSIRIVNYNQVTINGVTHVLMMGRTNGL